MNLTDALQDARDRGRPAVVPYLMVDRARSGRISRFVTAFREAGATALELGFPFSDPVADGPVLEAAAARALRDGTRWKDLLHACHEASGVLPTAVMTYANPVWSRGLKKAMTELADAGATGLIVPDLALEESAEWRRTAHGSGIALVLLAAPGIPPTRLDRIARSSQGFLYLVGRYGTTGATVAGTTVRLTPLIRRARRAAPKLPVLIGFGIRDRASVARALGQGADGFVIATAIEERLERGARPELLTSWLRQLAEVHPPRAAQTAESFAGRSSRGPKAVRPKR